MTTAKEVLAFIDQWADSAPKEEVKNLWSVLTALRGPDNGDHKLKLCTTAVIRGLTLPILSKSNGAFNNDGRYGEPVISLGDVSPEDFHFWSHITSAAKYLGLPFTPYDFS